MSAWRRAPGRTCRGRFDQRRSGEWHIAHHKMPIEFSCPTCSKLLRTPDESAGKKARCPQCSTIVDVPLSAPGGMSSPFTAPDAAGASPFSAPRGATGEMPPPKPAGPGTINPYASPAAAPSRLAEEAVEEAPRIGLPWERQEKSLKVFWETCMMILGSPTLAFSIMYREGGLGAPIIFALIGGAIGGALAGIYNTLLQIGVLAFVTAAGGQNAPPGLVEQTWVQVAIQLPVALAGGTIGMLIGSFIYAGLFHLFLMMLGGARYPFETTYRVVAYVSGATSLIQVIPLCGQYVVGLVALIYWIIGVSVAHRCGGGKAAAAILLPIVVCAVACGLLFGAAMGMAFIGAAQ
jgi:DNA-directed RNA polymerase subunit RPC12/RpoP